MLCLIVSGFEYNYEHDQRIIVEVVGETLATVGGLGVPLGEAVGTALIGTPMTVSLDWFAGSTEPVYALHEKLAGQVAERIRDLLGP
ncbi:hypothetical protein [Longispora fulva]|uniref:Uncharacterized protein n=1 Tax=Longispora fulva TaxID=619741 RepID=A0A8J7KXV8_9ACTN|nr:hypothetical protein [Longispora fulva]MBG6138392.1 hypothetical protein [Longispora fulva]